MCLMYIKTLRILLKLAYYASWFLKRQLTRNLNALIPILLWLFQRNDQSLSGCFTILRRLGPMGKSVCVTSPKSLVEEKLLVWSQVKKCLFCISSSQLTLKPWAHSSPLLPQPICSKGILSFCFVFCFLHQMFSRVL